MYDLLISRGRVVSPESTIELDVAIRGEQVAALAAPGTLQEEARRVIDARGLYVLPGCIDPHTHIRYSHTGRPVPGWEVTTAAAAYGGTTTIIDFADHAPNVSLKEAVELKQAEVLGRCAIDYAFHAILNHPELTNLSWEVAEQIPEAVAEGVPSFKVYLNRSATGPPAGDGFLLTAMEQVAQSGALLMVHAENYQLIDYMTQRLLRAGKTGVEYFSAAKPNLSEAEAVRRIILFAESTGAAIYFVHLSSKEAINALREAQAQGLPIYGETCPHYLAFTDDAYRQEFQRAIQFLRMPPIRGRADQEALWEGVRDGTIQVIGTDHVAANLKDKLELSQGRPFPEMPGGMAQIETRLGYLYSEGVAKGRITVNRLVELLASNPARLFGLYPRKGIIAPGSDADIVLFDPRVERRISNAGLHMGVDYTVYEGWSFVGAPVLTILRGKVVVEGEQFCGAAGEGQYHQRHIDPQVLKGNLR